MTGGVNYLSIHQTREKHHRPLAGGSVPAGIGGRVGGYWGEETFNFWPG